jgi:peptide/nickel transport system permease protein
VSTRAYIIRRLLLAVFVLVGITVVTFLVTHVVPSDPAQLYAGPTARGPALQKARELLKLDRPLYEQYFSYMDGLVRGDWGESLRTKRPIINDMLTYFPITLEIVIIALGLAFVVGVGLGAMTSQKRGGFVDSAMRIFAVAGVALPAFFIGLCLQVLGYRYLHFLPVGGQFTFDVIQAHPIHKVTGMPLLDALVTGNWAAFKDGARYVILPVIALAAYPMGVVMRMTRSSMLEANSQDYIRMARAMGVRQRLITYRYSLKNALGPVLTVAGLLFAYSIIGAFFIEYIFAWPGIGTYAITSIVSLDYPAIMGVTLLVAFIYALVNLVVDLMLVWIDPRVVLT